MLKDRVPGPKASLLRQCLTSTAAASSSTEVNKKYRQAEVQRLQGELAMMEEKEQKLQIVLALAEVRVAAAAKDLKDVELEQAMLAGQETMALLGQRPPGEWN